MRIVSLAAIPPGRWHEIVALWRAAFEHGMGLLDHHPIEQQHAAFVNQVAADNQVQVALDAELIVGFIAFSPESVAQLNVLPGWHGQGIGTRLLERAQAGSRGSLWLYTFARNAVARRFYERRGFVEIERQDPTLNMWNLAAIKYLWRRA